MKITSNIFKNNKKSIFFCWFFTAIATPIFSSDFLLLSNHNHSLNSLRQNQEIKILNNLGKDKNFLKILMSHIFWQKMVTQ